MSTVYDIDGTLLGESRTVTLIEGVTVTYHLDPGASKPQDIALRIGNNDVVEMTYTEALADMLGNIERVSAVELLTTCYANRCTIN